MTVPVEIHWREGRMRGKPTSGRRRIQTLHDLVNDGGFVALKRATENTE